MILGLAHQRNINIHAKLPKKNNYDRWVTGYNWDRL